MDPNLCSLVVIFSTSRMIDLGVDRAVSHKRTHALEISGQSAVWFLNAFWTETSISELLLQCEWLKSTGDL